MNKAMALETAMSVINTNNNALLGTISEDEYPNIKALIKMKSEGIKTFYFITNPISTKVQQIKVNNKSCVYFFDPMLYIGILLEGKAKIVNEVELNLDDVPRPDGLAHNQHCGIVFLTEKVTVYCDFEKFTFEL
jgi:general stress protein 26